MSIPTSDCRECERSVARLLRDGTWLASLIIAAGLIFESPHTVWVGIAVLIFLPVARVALMLAFFLRRRDYLYTAISALVLAIIGIGLIARL
ncbi:MAG TPA: DUF1634 domain-containing protein [Steroidobacteraceae bacterium]|jgi:uncharacterized membrane protein